MEKEEIIKISCKLQDPKGIFIPRGMIENLKIIITNGSAIFSFKNGNICKKFAEFEIEADKKKGLDQTTFFNKRTQKAVKFYDGKTKEEIAEILKIQLEKMGANIKK